VEAVEDSTKMTDLNSRTPRAGTKLPSLDDAALDIGPSKRRRGGFWDGNWITFSFVLPFFLMNLARVPLGISDAFLMGDRGDATYNLCMGLGLFFGSMAFLAHTFVLPIIKGYGWGWIAPKLMFLAAVWCSVFVVSWLLNNLHPVV
jgi:hypothetical protein